MNETVKGNKVNATKFRIWALVLFAELVPHPKSKPPNGL